MLDEYDLEARALFPEPLWGARLPPGLVRPFYRDVAAALYRKAGEMEVMRRDLFGALSHRHCCCDECVAVYRKWFAGRDL